MLWPKLLREWADRIEANPTSCEISIAYYHIFVNPANPKIVAENITIEMALPLTPEEIEKLNNAKPT